MTRRWKRQRAHKAHIAGHQSDEARGSFNLPAELWQITFSYCLPTTLFAVRDTCRLFRDIVDRDGGKLLAHSPLLLAHPPPDPRWFMRIVTLPGQSKVMYDFFGIPNPWIPGRYGSAVYTNILFRSGRCNICDAWTPGPPEWIHSKFYFCSKQCKLLFFRTEVTMLQPRFNYLPARSATPNIDRHIVPWLPTVTLASTSRGKRTQAVLIRDLERGREEYQSEVLSAPSPDEQAQRRKSLFQRYAVRCHWSRALYMFQCYIDEWRVAMKTELHKFKAENSRQLHRIAYKYSIPVECVARDAATQQLLRARSSAFRRITPSALTKAGLPSSKHRKRTCRHCGIAVSKSRYESHVANKHPGQLPRNRLNFDTGKTEYRCDLCPEDSVKWYDAVALRSHEYDV
ncbi:hypothetical protein K523DRAFT_300058 [Schizophyllum commune Tattone D]|nr:hypothetical protein K523DRAFT_300058 [Schizophyllum commune Tattone D]